MAMQWDQGQVSTSAQQGPTHGLPAGTTLTAIELECQVSFRWAGAVGGGMLWAPPNLMMGIGWALPQSPWPVVSTSNWGEPIWYFAGFGRLIASESYAAYSTVANEFEAVQTQQMYVKHVNPVTSTAAWQWVLSLNWLGAGFYGVTPFLTYTARVWYT